MENHYKIENGIVRFPVFEQYPFLQAGFSTNYIGNLGFKNTTPKIRFQNRQTFFQQTGLQLENAVFQDQMHTNNVRIITSADLGKGIQFKKDGLQNNDGMITAQKNIILTACSADCAPVYLFSPEKKVIALLHSGRTGTKKQIIRTALIKMKTEYEIDFSTVIAAIGPSICKNCYEINEQIEAEFKSQFCYHENGNIFLDIRAHLFQQLTEMGIKEIHDCGICSFEDERFFSYRREGKEHGTGIGFFVIKE
jgi:hypothetical protein